MLGIASSCQVMETGDPEPSGDNTQCTFSYSVPDFVEAGTRSAEGPVTTIALLAFDEQGLFVGKSMADVDNPDAGKFKAGVPNTTKYIHFIANYDWADFDEADAMGRDERHIIPALTTTSCVFWDRQEFTAGSPVNVGFLRNQVKISIEVDENAVEGTDIATGFKVDGLGVCGYMTSGTVSPFDPDASAPFAYDIDTPTIIPGVKATSDTDVGGTVKYIFESVNYQSAPLDVIFKAGAPGYESYFKVQLIDDDSEFYPAVRNTHFRIVLKTFIPGDLGVSTFEEAKDAPPLNNIYADIIRESPTISDGVRVLTVNPRVVLLTDPVDGSTIHSFEAEVEYTGTGANYDDIQVAPVTGGDLQLLSWNWDKSTKKITGTVPVVNNGYKSVEFRVRASGLSRNVTVVSCELFSFETAKLSDELSSTDQAVDLEFNIPDNVPDVLFPLEVKIATNNLYPTGSLGKTMLRKTEDGVSKYVYIVNKENKGKQTIGFKTLRADSHETIAIENPYFRTSYVDQRLALIVVNENHIFNGLPFPDNLVGYQDGYKADVKIFVPQSIINEGSGSVKVKFTIDGGKLTGDDARLTGGTSRLTPEDGGFTTIITTAGFHTFGFKGVGAHNASTITLSRFSDGKYASTLYYENFLTQDYGRKGSIKYGTGFSYVADTPIHSSNEAIVPNFEVNAWSGWNNVSEYNLTLKKYAVLSERVRLNDGSYKRTYSIRQLLDSPTIHLRSDDNNVGTIG